MNWGYKRSVADFLDASESSVLGLLSHSAANSGFFEHKHEQTHAWIEEIQMLKCVLDEIVAADASASEWTLLLEFEIPRRQRRIDAVILMHFAIVVLEFKIGCEAFDSSSIWQVREYGLDLRDFHAGSHGRLIFPVLVATGVSGDEVPPPASFDRRDCVAPVTCCGASGLSSALKTALELSKDGSREHIDAEGWAGSSYLPALSIIEAAQEFFRGHNVREISYCASDNLEETSVAILDAVELAKAKKSRVICFVTGVPGAGKTLVGLNAVHDPRLRRDGSPAAVFLSGNGPLVRIVRSALTRSGAASSAERRQNGRVVQTFIQNVHTFLKTHGPDNAPPPPEHVVVFDEAQRAWDAKKMSSPRSQPGGSNGPAKSSFEISEPELMLRTMERCPDWSVVVALVGGGQEIHDGEAGLQEWGRSILVRPVPWLAISSPEAFDGGASVAGQTIFPEGFSPKLTPVRNAALHLRTSIRSLRSLVVSDWVNAVLHGEHETARRLISDAKDFPMFLTRSLDAAKSWLLAVADAGGRQGACGLLASSGALRLRMFGIEVSSGFRKGFSYDDWFLAKSSDIRASCQMEVPATEFECQGLELDWTCVCWGGDLVRDSDQWTPALSAVRAGTKLESPGLISTLSISTGCC
jgi:hypothetical protein